MRILLMLAVCRRIVWQHANVSAGRWRGNNVEDVKLFELKGRTLGIVGLGSIGKKTARMAQAFGMTVQYYDVTRLSEERADDLGVRFALLDELLKTSDIVSLHVPLLAETRHMMGAAQFKLMKKTAYLINTCRGPVVDEPALIEALSDGTIAGAGLDVFDKEPPPTEQSAVRPAERHADRAFRRADLRQPVHPVPQRVRQLPAGDPGREAAVGHPGTAGGRCGLTSAPSAVTVARLRIERDDWRWDRRRSESRDQTKS